MGSSRAARRVAFTAPPFLPDLHDDWPVVRAAVEAAGMDGRTVVWSDPGVDWPAFDLVVANGVWDHIHRADEFLAWVDRIEELGVPIVNPPATLRWNLDKRYLRDLEAAGVSIVPIVWVEPPHTPAGPGDGEATPDLPDAEVVVKPAVSGGGHQTARYGPGEHDAARAHLRALRAQGRTAMVQPYVAAVDADGETGLVFLAGDFSHAVHKAPMIRRGAGPRESLIDNQVVTPATATPAQIALGHRALEVAESLLGPTTYARVDTVELADGTPAVLELELLDPVLFFVHHPQGAATFAEVLAARLTG